MLSFPTRPSLRTAAPLLAVLLMIAPMAPRAAVAGDDQNHTRIELVLVQDGGQTRGLSVSMAHGPYVDTAGLVTDEGVSTGAIASVNPVGKTESDDGYTLYTSTVGGGLE